MFMPFAIGFLIASIFFNLNIILNGTTGSWLKKDFSQFGRVLGAAEEGGTEKFFTASGAGLNQAMIKVMDEAKAGPMAPLWRLPLNREKTEEKPTLSYDLPAANGAILDCQDDRLVFDQRADRSWPIASITKLITAFVFLDYNPGWETIYEIKAADKREGGKIYLFTGDRVKIKDLFYFSLVGSDNTATAALVNSTGLSEEQFVDKMNKKVQLLGLSHTRLVDPIGLKDGNISTAREVAEFARVALNREEIRQASLTKRYEFTTEQGRKKLIESTNRLLDDFPEAGVNILGGKTGFINLAGYCLVGKFEDKNGRSIVTVVLGAADESSRFDLTKKLVDLYYKIKP